MKKKRSLILNFVLIFGSNLYSLLGINIGRQNSYRDTV